MNGAPQGDPAAALAGFVRHLRDLGYPVGSGETLDALRLAEYGALADRALLRACLKPLLACSRPQARRFDRLFDAWWFAHAPDRLATGDNPARPAPRGGRSLVGMQQAMSEGDGDDFGFGGAGTQGALGHTDFRFLTDPRDWETVARAAERLARRIRRRRSRRWQAATGGSRVDLRRSLRRLLATGGDPVHLAFRTRRPRPLRLVLLLDVSHSMAQYSPLLARFVRAYVNVDPRAEAFTFHVELTRVTELLRTTRVELLRQRLAGMTRLWFGGTRIADSLAAFNRDHLHRVAGPDTVVVLLSDGFDTHGAADLSAQLAPLRAAVRGVVWANPLLARYAEEEALEGPLAEASAHLDHVVEANTLASLERLGGVLATY